MIGLLPNGSSIRRGSVTRTAACEEIPAPGFMRIPLN